MSYEVWLLAIIVLFALGVCSLRISAWHHQEAMWWRRLAIRDEFGASFDYGLTPEQKAHYDLLALWCRANRPSLLRRVRGWEEPERRRQNAFREALR